MEIKRTILYAHLLVRLGLLLWMMLFCVAAFSQKPVKVYAIKDGKMHIELSRDLPLASLDSFINQFNLHDLGLLNLVKASSSNSLKKAGWQVKLSDAIYTITKSFAGFEKFNDPAERITFLEAPVFSALFPSQSNNTRFGYNRFKNKFPFEVNGDVVTFFLANQAKAQKVMLAGSFTNWGNNPLPMTKTDSGWIAHVKLEPGKYWYKFMVDDRWQVDNDNQLRENDGEGNINSVYFKPNTVFNITNHTNARRVFLAGSFNGWKPRDLPMQKTAGGWNLPIYLNKGTHTYKFVVDGKWFTDEQNPKSFPDEFGGRNSYIEIGEPHIFKLDGFTDAKEVILTGTFNNWQEHELRLKRTASGWALPYILGEGNYEYKFKVDGKWITDPANPITVDNPTKTKNSYLIIGANYTFRLKNKPHAKNVFVAGDFNNWSTNGLRMQRDGNDWIFKVHFGPGKHRYKFIVDDEWIIDPENALWEQNEYGTRNSIVWIEE